MGWWQLKPSKQIRQWVKQEKRIVRALYRSGFLDSLLVDWRKRKLRPSDEFYWADYHKEGRVLVPEVHYGQRDYYGEVNEQALSNDWFFGLTCPRCGEAGFNDEGEPVICEHLRKARHYRNYLVTLLEGIPAKRCDHAINCVLKTRKDQ